MQGLSAKTPGHGLGLRAEQSELSLEALAVELVAEERVPDMGEVHPDLVRASGLQSAGKEARDSLAVGPGIALQHLPMGDGCAAALAHRAFFPRMRVPVERRVDRPARALRRVPDEGEVAALQHAVLFAFLGELPGEAAMRLVVLG